ncbi:MAG TPA: SPASM domain-containing protein [bacterium]|nr:SPASM domain-containing protein [bacterium]HPN44985.1 SPASM domain-containing protein [bacterium]
MKITEYEFRECCFKTVPENGRKLVWEITHKCTFGCSYCFQTKKRMGNPLRILHPADFRKVILKMEGLRIQDVLLTGGELYWVRESLPDVCDTLRSANISFSISTNYIHDIDFVESLLELHPRALNISIDPQSTETREKVVRQLECVKRILHRCDEENIPVKVTGVVTSASLINIGTYLSDLSLLVKEHPSFSSLYFTYPHDIGYIKSGVRAKEAAIRKSLLDLDVPLELNSVIRFVNFYRFNAPLQLCPAGTSIVHIEPNGDVYPCHLFANLPKDTFLMGNILNDHITDIDKRLSDFGSRTKDAIEEYKLTNDCNSCRVKQKCGGGCLAEVVSLGQLIEPQLVCKKIRPPIHRVLFEPITDVLPLSSSKTKDLSREERIAIMQYITDNLSKGHDLAHGLDHVESVVKYARFITKAEGADLRTVSVAAFFHDFEPRRQLIFEQHTEYSAQTAVKFLKTLGFMDAELNAVYECIVSSSYGAHEIGLKPISLEAKCVRDADWLDAIGARGIARVFAFAAAHGCEELGRVEWPLDPPPKKRMSLIGPDPSPIYHFFSKLLWVSDQMATTTGRSIAKKRHEMMLLFLRAYKEEMDMSTMGELDDLLNEDWSFVPSSNRDF